MGGPRVTSGSDSKQDYGTPGDLLAAVEDHWGPICFDLAAHAANKKHERYFAPSYFTETYDPEEHDDDAKAASALVWSLARRGAATEEAEVIVRKVFNEKKKTKFTVPNRDKKAYGLDAFEHSWVKLSRKFEWPSGTPGLLWLNCEFSDIAPWAARSKTESALGANVLLLTPVAVGANWWRDHVAGVADTYFLNGRLCFDGKNPFPKDCALYHFSPDVEGNVYLWDWRKRTFHRTWSLEP